MPATVMHQQREIAPSYVVCKILNMIHTLLGPIGKKLKTNINISESFPSNKYKVELKYWKYIYCEQYKRQEALKLLD
jgi:hypothetical protein